MKKDKKKINHSLVGIIMGSKSDWGTMKHCSDTLKNFKIRHDVRVISAHRTPQRLHKYLKEAEKKGIEIIIAGAGGAAHLAGVTASITTCLFWGYLLRVNLRG